MRSRKNQDKMLRSYKQQSDVKDCRKVEGAGGRDGEGETLSLVRNVSFLPCNMLLPKNLGIIL